MRNPRLARHLVQTGIPVELEPHQSKGVAAWRVKGVSYELSKACSKRTTEIESACKREGLEPTAKNKQLMALKTRLPKQNEKTPEQLRTDTLAVCEQHGLSRASLASMHRIGSKPSLAKLDAQGQKAINAALPDALQGCTPRKTFTRHALLYELSIRCQAGGASSAQLQEQVKTVLQHQVVQRLPHRVNGQVTYQFSGDRRVLYPKPPLALDALPDYAGMETPAPKGESRKVAPQSKRTKRRPKTVSPKKAKFKVGDRVMVRAWQGYLARRFGAIHGGDHFARLIGRKDSIVHRGEMGVVESIKTRKTWGPFTKRIVTVRLDKSGSRGLLRVPAKRRMKLTVKTAHKILTLSKWQPKSLKRKALDRTVETLSRIRTRVNTTHKPLAANQPPQVKPQSPNPQPTIRRKR